MKLKNTDGSKDNKVTTSDITKIGDTNPLCSGGFTVNGRLYGFDLTANFTYSIGNDVYNANKIEYTTAGKYKYRNMIDIMADGNRWTNLNSDGTICNDPEQLAAMNVNTTMWSPWMQKMVLSDWAVEDGFIPTSGYLINRLYIAADTNKKSRNSESALLCYRL